MQQPDSTHQKPSPSQWANLAELIGIETLPRSWVEKSLCTIGAFVSLMAVYVITTSIMGPQAALPVVASMGATSLLLFSVPHGALSQPWPVFMGQVVSATVGVTVAKLIPDPLIGAPLAVALCTLLMLLGRCLHPPGAASALTVIFASDAVREMGYDFVLMPVALNATILIIIAITFNAPFKGRRYPSGWHDRQFPQVASSHEAGTISHERFIKAVEELDTFIDVSEEDLLKLHNLIYKKER
ncbi:MAG: HPP family protein [Hyphomicrobiaceae bacterium]|nr:HPP family protein [Hyphomicrobiaceae bacterium]